MNCGAEFQPQSIQPNEPSGVALIVAGCTILHRRDLSVIQTFRTLAACHYDIALVEFESHNAGNVSLRFRDQGL